MRWEGHVAHMREKRDAYRGLIWNPQGKRGVGGPWGKWEDNIKMDRIWKGWYRLDSSGLGKRLVEGSCEHSNKRSGSTKRW
jgi:hypothetical protein